MLIKKSIFTLILAVLGCYIFSNSSNSEKSLFYLSDTSQDLYDTGIVTQSHYFSVLGKYLNPVISPHLFYSYGFGITKSRNYPFTDFFNLVLEPQVTLSFLNPSIENKYSYVKEKSFMARGNFYFLFAFDLPSRMKSLKITLAPYIKLSVLSSFHSEIQNIPYILIMGLNFGLRTSCTYKILKKLRLGGDISLFLLGLDTGRHGYNHFYRGDFLFTHPGNYFDLNLGFFAELDFSRTESLNIKYSHDMTFYGGGLDIIINGEHRLGLAYKVKLIR